MSLLLQKFKIPEDLEVYDDGYRWLLVLDNAPEYMPRNEHGQYVEYGGKYGDCVVRNRETNNIFRLVRADQLGLQEKS